MRKITINSISVLAFRALAQNSGNADEFARLSLPDKYAFLGMRQSIGYTSRAIGEELSNKIKACVAGAGKLLNKVFFHSLKTALIYDTIVLKNDNRSLIKYLETIRDSSDHFPSLEEREIWEQSIVYAKYQSSFEQFAENFQAAIFRDQHPREVDTARAMLGLAYLDCEIELKDDTFVLKTGLDKIVQEIESEIDEFGGINFMKNIFDFWTRKIYNPKLKRYLFSSAVPLTPSKMSPAVPFGFLLDIAVKYPLLRDHSPSENIQNKARWDRIIERSKLVLGALDIQSYNPFESTFLSGDELIKYIQDAVQFDTATTISQSSPDMELDTIPILFQWVDNGTFEGKTGFSIEHYVSVASMILTSACDICGPTIFDFGFLESRAQNLNINVDNLRKILSVITHPPGEANRGHSFINDAEQRSFRKKPLIQLADSRYLLCDKSWCCMGFYEALAMKVKALFDADKAPGQESTDKKIGKALEGYVFDQLNQKGLLFSSGEFVDLNGEEAESDVILEAERDIVLVEIKKKKLTDLARAGDVTSAVLDLGSSLLYSQIQAGKAELVIRQNGFIELDNGVNRTRIDLNNRKVLRISLTHYDFDSFQDRVFAKSFLQLFLSRTVEPFEGVGETLRKGLLELNKKGEEWRTQYEDLIKIDKSIVNTNNPFFNSTFLSLGQLLMILDDSTDNNSFVSGLKKTWHIWGGTKNTYLVVP